MYSAVDIGRKGGITITIKYFDSTGVIRVQCNTQIGTEIEHLSKKFTALAQDVEDDNKFEKAVELIIASKHPCIGMFGTDMDFIWETFDKMRKDGKRNKIIIGNKEKIYATNCEIYGRDRSDCCEACALLKGKIKYAGGTKRKRKRNYDCQRSQEQR